MAEVLIAAAPGDETRGHALAEALKALGLDVAAETPAEANTVKGVDGAKCVLALWSAQSAAHPWLTAQATLALERKKLISAELERGAAPALFNGAPSIDLKVRDRTAFRTRFQTLIGEIEKLTEAKAKTEALPDALAKARAGLLQGPPPRWGRWTTTGAFAGAVVLLFVIGFGAGRVINAVRSGALSMAPHSVEANAAETAAPISVPIHASGDRLSAIRQHLESDTWRETAHRIDEATAREIKTRAASGDAMAQALGCLGHLAGATGFLPSPAAARTLCDASAESGNVAGNYFSWVLQRSAPQAGMNISTARARLAEAARQGWLPALIDYAQVLAPNDRAPLADQTEAGRLFLAAAERGDARGQYFYARWLRDSPAGPRDPSAALPYLERAAQSGQLEATHMLATLYRDGIGVTRNADRAKTLYDQAARQHYPPSMFNLADMMRTGGEAERGRAVALYRQLACLPDERQIQPMALARLRGLHETWACR
jgi:TPR repeat protein